jgi:hypothetical protein
VTSLSNRALDAAQRVLSGEGGLKASVEAILEQRQQPITEARLLIERRLWNGKQTGKDAGRDRDTRLPRVAFSLTRLSSKGAEKLARSSARATLEVLLTVSSERADLAGERLTDLADAVIDLLDRHRGLWDTGVFYAGEFQVDFEPLTQGGLNYTQTAAFEIEIYLWQE